MANLPEASTYRVQYIAPDASVRLDTGEQLLGNPPYRVSWWRWHYAVELDRPGLWEIRFDVNGERLTDAPFNVVATEAEIVNRPPSAVDAVRLDPSVPNERNVVFCRVSNSLLLDDPDYDVVRYHYRWEVNGELVREMTHAGQADAIPWPLIHIGDTVRCTVNPSDGNADGPTTMAEAVVVDSFHCPGDCDEQGAVTVDEVVTLVDIALGSSMVTRCLAGEIDGDGEVRVDELLSSIGSALDGCRPRPTPPPATATSTAPTQTPTSTPPPTPTRTPSSTPISCDFNLPQVEPLISPASNIVQTIRGTILVTSDRQDYSVCNHTRQCHSGALRGVPPELTFASAFSLSEGLNRFEVCTFVAPDCNEFTCTRVATDGSPLEVIYVPPTPTLTAQVSTPTFTPLPTHTIKPDPDGVETVFFRTETPTSAEGGAP